MRLLIVVLLTLVFVACKESNCIDSNCEDYVYQESAQSDFDSDPDCHGDLDADNDGEACEHLPQRPAVNCPTTANCGCSNKPMSDCEADPCCKWVVGSGCECA